MSNRELKTQKSVGWTELGQEFIDACYQGDEAEVGNLLTIAGAKKRDFNTQDQYRKGVMTLYPHKRPQTAMPALIKVQPTGQSQ